MSEKKLVETERTVLIGLGTEELEVASLPSCGQQGSGDVPSQLGEGARPLGGCQP